MTEKTLDNKKTTIDEKRRTYKDFMALYGDLDINQITKPEIVAWKTAEIGRKLSANRINKRLGQVNDFSNWSIKNGHYTAHPSSPVEGLFVSKKAKLAKATENREPFTEDEIKALFGKSYQERFFANDHYCSPLVCLFSGARREEAGHMFTLRLREDCGITNTRKTFHSLRHTVITRLQTADANPAHVKQIAGHSSEAQGVHFQTYTHAIGLAQLAETLNRLIYPHDFASLELPDPTFKAFFANEKTAEEKHAEREAKNAKHSKAVVEREERNRDKRRKTIGP